MYHRIDRKTIKNARRAKEVGKTGWIVSLYRLGNPEFENQFDIVMAILLNHYFDRVDDRTGDKRVKNKSEFLIVKVFYGTLKIY